jgi:hypothetical protein
LLLETTLSASVQGWLAQVCLRYFDSLHILKYGVTTQTEALLSIRQSIYDDWTSHPITERRLGIYTTVDFGGGSHAVAQRRLLRFSFGIPVSWLSLSYSALHHWRSLNMAKASLKNWHCG